MMLREEPFGMPITVTLPPVPQDESSVSSAVVNKVACYSARAGVNGV